MGTIKLVIASIEFFSPAITDHDNPILHKERKLNSIPLSHRTDMEKIYLRWIITNRLE